MYREAWPEKSVELNERMPSRVGSAIWRFVYSDDLDDAEALVMAALAVASPDEKVA